MASSGPVQIPFSAFKLIELGQSVALELYQALYNDHTEPVGLISVIQALGLIYPSDKAVDSFNQRWARGSASWKIQETGIKVVTGKSSTTGEMVRTRDGEATAVMLSFLLHSMKADTVTEIVRTVINATPSNLVPIRPRRAQIKNVVDSVEAQTSCVSWQEEISDAEKIVFECPQIWTTNSTLPQTTFDIPPQCMAAYYQALCAVTRFPGEYHCVLETSSSIAVPFALAHAICGLRVCVLVDGELLHGNPSTGRWQVRLVRRADLEHTTKVKIGRRIEDVQDILVLDDVGPIRANRVSIKGIGKAATIGQGIMEGEARDLAILSIGVAVATLSQMKREVLDYGDNGDSTVSYRSSSLSETGHEDTASSEALVPIQTRVTPAAVAFWWDSPVDFAQKMLVGGVKSADLQPQNASWNQIKFGKETIGKIAEFESLNREEQIRVSTRAHKPWSRDEYSKLLHTLTSQLLLICFLGFGVTSQNSIHVRSSCEPQNTSLGKAVKCLRDPGRLGQTDILCSWYHWIKGASPKDFDCVDAFTTEGFLIYRSLLLDINLSAEACETVVVEPGHLMFENYRTTAIQGYDSGYMVIGHPRHRKRRDGPLKLRSGDKTGQIETQWTAEEVHGVLELTLQLHGRSSSVSIDTSIYQIAKRSWSLLYGDSSIGCSHDEEYPGMLVNGETIEELTPGNGPKLDDIPEGWKPIKLYKSHDNRLGQVACLLSADGRGLVKAKACLRCCLSTAQKLRLDFVID
jgi:hypothetical protein